MDTTPTHLTPPELAERWGKAPQTLRFWRHKGLGPTYDKIGPRTILYPIAAVEEYEQRHRIEPVADHRPHKQNEKGD